MKGRLYCQFCYKKEIILMLFEINFQAILLTPFSAQGWALKPIRAVVVQNVGDL